jgi:hypothetical protein
MKKEKTITRRDFLKGTAGIVLTSAIGSALPSIATGETKSRVVVVRDDSVLDEQGQINSRVLQAMLDEAVRSLTRKKTAREGWKTLIKKSDIVGIKTNAWRQLSTPREMELAIRQRVVDVGVAEKNLAIDDKGVRNNPIFQNSTALINTRPLRTHHWAGTGTCLKNYIMFVPAPSEYHPDGCSALGKIWMLPVVQGKTRLNVLVALTPQFYGRGANFFDRRYVWSYKGIIVGTDPVAVDAVGAELLRKKRIAHFGEDKALDVTPQHITVADKTYKLGNSDLNKIEIVKIGWKEDILL